MYRIVQKRKTWFSFSVLLIIVSFYFIFTNSLKFGIDFTGGSLINYSFSNERPHPNEINEKLKDLSLGEITIQPVGDSDLSIRLKNIDEAKHQQVLSTLSENYEGINEISFETIGPTIGKELRQKSITATVLVLLFILIYITFVFRKAGTEKFKSWMLGLGAIIALIHDIIIVVGFYAILCKFTNAEVNTLFITALLTVLGFSIHDTIVVYDRIRERLKSNLDDNFETTVNVSLNQTMVRSINTSLTTILVLLSLFIFGGETIRWFNLTLIVGIFIGTYSSIFIASSLLITWHNYLNKE